jgi:hypothetical protein
MDSHRETTLLEELDERAQPRPLTHDELMHLPRCAQEAQIVADPLPGNTCLQEIIWHAPHEVRSGRPPVLSNSAIQFCLSVIDPFKLLLG